MKDGIKLCKFAMKRVTPVGLLMTGALLLGTGCASFPSRDLSGISIKPAATHSENTELTLSLEVQNRVLSGAGWKFGDTEALAIIRDTFQTSGEFGSIREARFGGDLHVSCYLKMQTSPKSQQIDQFSFLTAYLIPFYKHDRLVLEADVYRKAELLKSYTFRNRSRVVNWLPAIVLAPFYSPHRSRNVTLKNTTDHLLLQLRKDEILPLDKLDITKFERIKVPPLRGFRSDRELYQPLPK